MHFRLEKSNGLLRTGDGRWDKISRAMTNMILGE